MHRASTILQTTRLAKELDYQDISQKTKTPVKYLLAIENEDIQNLPNEPYCSLIVKDYADFLGLNGQNILSLFRRDVLTRKHFRRPRRSFFALTPKIAVNSFIIISLLLFSAYLIFEYIKFNQPPPLNVKWPESIATSIFEIQGTTDPQAVVRINDSLVIVDDQGNFSKKIDPTGFDGKIIVSSESRSGRIVSEEKIYQK